ncbi:hypothetical protein DACRYDRAFT_13403 [Dacryopinax primogenitus]|uniref:Uncharacterized protein n=1 Tax=Dacryopinax primogenitus (strain DJM 731) TaxID=1858805 RepID=M5GGE6_DACPD|nr:uncharacterized protein DACRYDRAFT_13403 [Dacryopinax primogenitus]EJU05353.1 hypothetical protein DACRYDRAFT_13403 [Dacryopinax primogenitus]
MHSGEDTDLDDIPLDSVTAPGTNVPSDGMPAAPNDPAMNSLQGGGEEKPDQCGWLCFLKDTLGVSGGMSRGGSGRASRLRVAEDEEARIGLIMGTKATMSVTSCQTNVVDFDAKTYAHLHHIYGRTYGYVKTNASLQCISWCGCGTMLMVKHMVQDVGYCMEVCTSSCISCVDMIRSGGCVECCCGLLAIFLIFALIGSALVSIMYSVVQIYTKNVGTAQAAVGMVTSVVAVGTAALKL